MFGRKLQRIPAQVALTAYNVSPIRIQPVRDVYHDALVVYLEEGQYILRCHWGVKVDVLEEEDRLLSALNSFGARLCKPFKRNIAGAPVTMLDNICWTMQEHISDGKKQPSSLANRDYFGKRAENVGEALANVHAAGWWYLHHTGQRIDRFTFDSLPDRLRSIVEKRVFSAEAIADSFPGSPDGYVRQMLPRRISHFSGDFGYVVNGMARKPERFGRLGDAKLEWAKRTSVGPITIDNFQDELDKLVVSIESEEAWLDSPRTVLHGNLSSASLVVNEDSEEIRQVIGWKRFGVGSPMYDVGFAAVNFFTIWWDGESTDSERDYLPPQRLAEVSVFNNEAFGRFFATYRANMIELISDDLPSSSFGAAIDSKSLLIKYMKLACFNLICDALETPPQGEVERRCKKLVLMRLLHLLRILRQTPTND
jgi:hypothetical protein